MFDNDIAIEDDILRVELSKASEARIKTIINTIQTEQNRAIRAESGDLLVYGPAGSGKTSVGLHRIAYLLYRHRESLSSAKVRIFSPSSIFTSYIQGIIPELGEEDVLTLDFPTLVEKKGRLRAFHGHMQMLQSISEARTEQEKTRVKWIQIKFSAEFLDHVEAHIAAYSPSFEDALFYTDTICTKERLEALYQDRTTAGTLYTKSERVLSYVNRCFDEYFKENLQKITDLFNNIHDENFSDGEVRMKFDEEKQIVMADLRNRTLPKAQRLLEKCLKSIAKRQGMSFSFAKDALRMEKLFFEDALSLFYINLCTGRTAAEKDVKHILLDEAQDFGVLHHRILRRMYPASRFTVLADTNQAIFPEININTTAQLMELYPQAEVIPLTKSYRSTYEIMHYAAGFLKGNENADENASETTAEPGVFLRHGEEPATIETNDHAQAVSEILASTEYKTVGIILPTISEARDFHAQLLTKLPNAAQALHLITAETNDFPAGVMVIAAPFVKGLEFDVVIAPCLNPATPQNAKLNYLICTRALHRLYFTKPTD